MILMHEQAYGRKVLRWLIEADKRSSDWQMEGIRRSLRLTLSWLYEGRTLYDASPLAYLCVMTPGGRIEIRHCNLNGGSHFDQLPVGIHLGRAGILMNPGEALLVDRAFVAGLLEEQLSGCDTHELTRTRRVSSLIPPGAGLPPDAKIKSATG